MMTQNRKISRRKIVKGLAGAAVVGATGLVVAEGQAQQRRTLKEIQERWKNRWKKRLQRRDSKSGRLKLDRNKGLVRVDPEFDPKRMYSARPGERFALPAVPYKDIPERFYRRRVKYRTREKPGTLIVDTKSFFLHLVEPNGTAIRYGVGLGRAGFEWAGRARVAWKQEWPKWTPPAEMIARQPELEKWSEANGGHPPGLDNPLGARALYIFQGNVDTLYRLHGSPEHLSIGRAVSSGCVRLLNQDVIDLYNRVKSNSKIVVT